MFTGIVEELGEVNSIQRGSQSVVLEIKATEVLSDVQVGDSIATNGVCLTVTSFSEDRFTVDVMPETMRKSSLGELKIGDIVNLERALRLQDRLGGHLVSGHIDSIGTIKKKEREDNAVLITISLPQELKRLLVPKGSIAIDGISLTIAELTDDAFTVSLIPHTAEVTTLGAKGVGDIVNLEADLIGKYVERMLNFKDDDNNSKSEVDFDLLQQNGFL
ncbi:MULTISPECIES: riboflavin synthase [unclassified Candidatus Frackibacter]|uniref:riboflavin synthase n=1 Tax=unclassified Candidatus Frackibacter TaxID=2648818 RepID=UPI00087EB76F|nr:MULTISPECIES: riboflavin synthase [unclassified Candidatus Frackibacter]SDC57450.1 riboflavin synthase alpha chain [Candidatus Frackibacter sp. WG11]SEM71539.1 riboflavin synthase alpha chain [Candidatus Frackibacter sp. WG12]SFL82722.1 riboflavin synthase alpha chain [Candidatus Frackibacter sp. WG13]